MIFQALALFLGILAGTFTGLFPSLHVNLVAAITLSTIPLIPFDPIIIAIFIISLAITHTFLDFIPSTFLGAPDEDNFLAILPGHQLLQYGLGQEAVVLTLYGSLIALPTILIFTPVFINFLPTFLNIIQTFIPYLLIFISFFLIFKEEEFLISLTVFSLSGFLGFLTFSLPVKEPLLPLLTGLFGLSALFISIKNKTTIPNQKIQPLKKIILSKKDTLRATLAAILAAPLSSFLPGIGSGHAAVIGSELIPQKQRGFLFLVGAINTIVMGLSFITIYSIGKTRTGAAAAINEIIPTITLSDLTTIILTTLISGLIAFTLGLQLAKLFAKNINKINYQKLTFFIIIVIIIVNTLITNLSGLLIMATSTALGIYSILSKSRRINLMGALLIPTIIFYLF